MRIGKRHWQRFGRLLPIGMALVGVLMGLLTGFGASDPIQAGTEAYAPEAGPDLVITSIVIEPINPAINQSVTITVTVRNQGDVAVSGSRVHLYVDPAQQPPVISTTHTTTNFYGLSLPPGSSYSFARVGQTFATNGAHIIYAWVDRDNTVAESDETNNVLGPVTLTVGSSGSTPDLYEDDDTCAQAATISVNGPAQLHTLSPTGDADWVKFLAVGGVSYVLEASPDGANGADADLQLETYTECEGKPSLGSGQRQVFKPLIDGTYYAKVDHSQATYGPKTAYKLTFVAENSCSGNYESNNICTTATEIQVNGGPQTHNFCEAADQDWVKFPVQAGGVYVASVTKEGAQADVELSLFPTCDRVLGAEIGQTLSFTAPSNGFVFLRTQSNNPVATGSGTNYRVEVMQAGSGCGTDDYEDDNTPTSAKPISPNSQAQTRRICPPGEKDWARFEATKGLTYTIETLNLANQADTVMCIFDSTGGTQLVCSDDDGPGAGSRIIWQPPTSGPYLVQVRHFNSSVAGPNTQYDLHILATATTCTLDTAEPDNSQAEAKTLTVNSAAQGRNICGADDVDWVAFNISAGPHVLQAASIGPEADSVLEIYNEAGTRLASNDDYDPGTSAQIAYTFSTTGRYFARVRHYNPERQGNGTEYQISLRTGRSTPPPTPSPTPSPTPAPPTQPQVSTEVQTLILVNRARMESLSNSSEANALMSKLSELAASRWVTGVVVQLEGNTTVRAAYDAWLPDMLNVSKANQVATAIRNLILQYREQYPSLKYLVLVGSDEALPFYRLHDNITRDLSEEDYGDVSDSHPTGAALRKNYFLSDDYYANTTPLPFQGRLLYTPDIAIGRLVETPADIRTFIQNFLAAPKTVAGNVLVTGYDFVQDTAIQICQYWKGRLGAGVNCDLIGDGWTLDQLRNLRLASTYNVQSINGHANHYSEGTTDKNVSLTAEAINNHSVSFIGDLVYSVGCHSGLNVPSSNFIGAIDLAEAFMRKGANYVGNTGYGYGLLADIGLSENLMRLYTDELLKNGTTSMGKALMEAKRRYVMESPSKDEFDEKVVQQVVFYGLPMYELQTSVLGSTPNENRFPSVSRNPNLPPGVLGEGDPIVTGTLNLTLPNALNPDSVMTRTVSRPDGSYYALDGSIHAGANQPVQPLFYENVTASNKPARSVIIKEATYKIIPGDFDPVIPAPMNEYITVTGETLVSNAVDWYPPYPATLQTLGDKSNLVVQMGQYNVKTRQLRLFGSMKLELTYSTSADKDAPNVTVVDALYNTKTEKVSVKLGATDTSGIESVSVSYAYGNVNVTRSEDLRFDPASQKWVGTFAGDPSFNFQALVKDKAGNVTIYPHKGNRLVPARATNETASNRSVFLPMVLR